MRILKFIIIGLGFLQLVSCGGANQKQDVDTDKIVDTYIQLGMGYLREGKKDQARFNLLKAIDADSRSPEANSALALLYQSEGETTLAEKHYKKAIDSDKNFNQARYNFAGMLLASERFEEAEKQYSVLTEDVNYRLRAQSFLGLGKALEKQGDLDAAKDAFIRSYQRDPRLTIAFLELAGIALQQEDFVSAKGLLDQFEKDAEASPRSLKLGIDLAQKFNDADAEASYALALRNLFPNSREAREHILATQGE